MKDLADKSFYDAKALNPASDMEHATSAYLLPYVNETHRAVVEHFKTRTKVTSLELGAGTCTLSLYLSGLEIMGEMNCMDISAQRMRTIAPESAKRIPGAHLEKLVHHEGSFNEPIPFIDGSVDLILFDAAFHHASSPWDLLAECRRVLAPGGLLVAQREAYLAYLTASYAIKRTLQTDEVTAGVVENIYLRAQYEYFLRARGFDPRFIPIAETRLQRALAWLNGWVYSKWVIVARPV